MKKWKQSVLAALLLAGVLAGCGAAGAEKKTSNTEVAAAGTEQSATEEKKELTHVKMSYFASVSWAPAFVAKEQGFFEEEGLDVELTTPGGPKGFQAMQAGDSEFAFLSMEPALVAAEKGVKTTFFTTVLKGRYYCIATRNDITDLSQLKGTNIFGESTGSGPYVFVCDVLQSAGLNPETDVTFVSMDANNALLALEKGEVSAVFMEPHLATELEGTDMHLLVDTRKEEDCIKYFGRTDFPAEGVCTTPEFAAEHPEEVQAATNAILKAAKWISEHSDEEVAKSLSVFFEGVDEERLAKWVGAMRDYYVTDGKISREGYQAVNALDMHAGVVSREVPYEDMVDPSFAENAVY